MTKEKMLEEFEQWRDESPNQRYGYVVWEAWQVACASKQKEIDAFNRTKLYSLDSIEHAIFNHDSDGCDIPETDGKYQQRRQEWAGIKLFLLHRIDTHTDASNNEFAI